MSNPSSASPENAGEPDREADLFFAAADLSDDVARAVFLDHACAGDAALRRRIEALLRAERRAAEFFAAHPSGPTVEAHHASDSADLVAPPSIPRHRLLEKLGEGGCGVVYRAEQIEPVLREVAIKVIKPGMDTRAVIRRFAAERQSLARMEHPHIARILDAGATAEGRPFFVMELVRGPRITEHCEREQLNAEARLKLFIQVCEALQHAHQKGVIHRDIKPSNVLVTTAGGEASPKVIDFGIAKAIAAAPEEAGATVLTHAHQFIGTPAYMSPEQVDADGRDLDTRSDIYALGVLLYELLVGAPPFEREQLESSPETLRKTLRERDPLRPSAKLARRLAAPEDAPDEAGRARLHERLARLRGDLDAIVMKCLEKDRERRYESAAALAQDLRRHLAHEPVSARPASRAYQLGKAVRRNRLVFAAGAVVTLALLVGGGFSAWQAVRATRAGRAAEAARVGEARQRDLAEQAAKEADSARAIAEEARAAAERDATAARRAAARADASMLVTNRLLPEAVERLSESFKLGPKWEDGLVNHLIASKARNTWSFVGRLPTPAAPDFACFAGTSKSLRLIMAHGKQLRVHDPRTEKIVGEASLGDKVRLLLPGASADQIVVLTNASVEIRSLPSLDVLHRHALPGPPVEANGNGDFLLVLLHSGEARLLDWRTLALIDSRDCAGQAESDKLGALKGCAVSADGLLVLLRGVEWRNGTLRWDRRKQPAGLATIPITGQQIRIVGNRQAVLWRNIGDAGWPNGGYVDSYDITPEIPVLRFSDYINGEDLLGGYKLQAWRIAPEKDELYLGFIGRSGVSMRLSGSYGVSDRYANLLPTDGKPPAFLTADLPQGWLATQDSGLVTVYETGRAFAEIPMLISSGTVTREGVFSLYHAALAPDSITAYFLGFDAQATFEQHALQWMSDGAWAPVSITCTPDRSTVVVVAQEGDFARWAPVAGGKVRALVYRVERASDPWAAWKIDHVFALPAAPFTDKLPRVSTISSDGTVFIYWTSSDTVERYDVRSGRCLGELVAGKIAAFSRDGDRIASCSADGRLLVQEIGSCRTLLEKAVGRLDSICFTEDGNRVAVTIQGRIDVWDVSSGKRVSTLDSPLQPIVYPSVGDRFLAYQPEGKAGSGGCHVLADTRDGRVITLIGGARHGFARGYFSDSGRQIGLLDGEWSSTILRSYSPDELVAALEARMPAMRESVPLPPMDLSNLGPPIR